MDQLVSVIQRLHEALEALGDASLRLPAVVAVGGQSSGKSSVLENIVGRYVLAIVYCVRSYDMGNDVCLLYCETT